MSAEFAQSRQAFKAYDIRGRVPEELNEQLALRLGAAFAQIITPKTVAIGFDIRLSSPQLCQAIIDGLTSYGVRVVNIGMCGTEEIYYYVGQHRLDGGIMVTASHNPANYNGIKMVGQQSRPIGNSNGLAQIRDLVLSTWQPTIAPEPSLVTAANIHQEFAQFVLQQLKPGLSVLADKQATAPKRRLKVVCNPGNGGAGLVLHKLAPYLKADLIFVDDEPDGSFPHGVPNPLLPERRQATTEGVLANGADFGAAWDGDFDRCFFFDEQGRFIEGYYLVALMAQRFLGLNPGCSIIHDPRLTWNTIEVVSKNGGKPVLCQTGHAFIKEKMRACDAIYGGEMSAHHYFRDFFYCDSGILPWLFMLEHLSYSTQPLSALVNDMLESYPVSGEINRRISEPVAQVLERVQAVATQKLGPVLKLDHTDGLSLEFAQVRFNLRASNTEPLLRLNVEARNDSRLLQTTTALLLQAIGGEPA